VRRALAPTSLSDMAEHSVPEEEPVCKMWPRFIQAVLAVFMVAVSGFVGLSYWPPSSSDLKAEVQELKSQVEELKQEQTMPAMVLNRYRNSICYIYGVYQIGYANQKPISRTRISGTGFVVADGLLATNRHVAEPWYGDPESDALINKGASPQLEKLVAFFPGLPMPVDLTPVVWSQQGDLAILRTDTSEEAQKLRPLPLAQRQPNPGELVAVIGYPMGILGMVAKSPPAVYERLAFRHDDIGAAHELAALSLIRPSATCGHLGDVVGDKLIYDAPTAHGASGGPVFNSQGEVIGINAAYIDGFSGGTLGVSISALKPLIEEARRRAPQADNAKAVPDYAVRTSK
jgi:Trypsin-like peptidase domain